MQKTILILGSITFLNEQTDGTTSAEIHEISSVLQFDTLEQAEEHGELALQESVDSYLIPAEYKHPIKCPASLITFEMIEDLLPATTSLTYVDYRDNLDDHHELLQECISNGNFDSLYEKIDDWYWESEHQGMEYVLDELIEDLEQKYNLQQEEADELVNEKYEWELRDAIRDRCDDDILKDLLRNTSDPIMHYDTGYYMGADSWSWSDKEVYQEMQAIKKFLGVRAKKYNDRIEMMIRQATYGGKLLIFFKGDIDDFMQLNPKVKSIEFTDAHIGIIDHCNGSGDITELDGSTIKLPFKIENVFLEQSIKYNWTYSIAGMCHDWCDSTGYSFSLLDKGEIKKSTTHAHLEQERKYNETYKAGSCTFGDMDIRRHRKAIYINDYPCGNKCQDCGTFWID